VKFNFGESQGDWGWGVGKGKRLDTLRNLPKASLRGWSAIVGQALSLCHPQRLRWSFPLPQSKLRRLRWFPPPCTEASGMVLSPSPNRTVEDACPNTRDLCQVSVEDRLSPTSRRHALRVGQGCLRQPCAPVEVASQPRGCGRSKPLPYRGNHIFFPIAADLMWGTDEI